MSIISERIYRQKRSIVNCVVIYEAELSNQAACSKFAWPTWKCGNIVRLCAILNCVDSYWNYWGFFQWKIGWTTINVTAPLHNFASQVSLSYFKGFYIYFNWKERVKNDSFIQDDSPKNTDSLRSQTSQCLYEWAIDSFTWPFCSKT